MAWLSSAWNSLPDLGVASTVSNGYQGAKSALNGVGTAYNFAQSPSTEIINFIFSKFTQFEANPKSFDELILGKTKVKSKELKVENLSRFDEFAFFQLFYKDDGITFLKGLLSDQSCLKQDYSKKLEAYCAGKNYPLTWEKKLLLSHFIDEIYALKFHQKGNQDLFGDMIKGVIDQSKVWFSCKITETLSKEEDLEKNFFSQEEVQQALRRKDEGELSRLFAEKMLEKLGLKDEEFTDSFITSIAQKYASYLLSDSQEKNPVAATCELSRSFHTFYVSQKVKSFVSKFASWVEATGNEKMGLNQRGVKSTSTLPGVAPAVAFLGPAFMDAIEGFIEQQEYFKGSYQKTLKSLDQEIDDKEISRLCDLSTELIIMGLQNAAGEDSNGKFHTFNINYDRTKGEGSVPFCPLGDQNFLGIGESEFRLKLQVFLRVISIDTISTCSKMEGNLYSIFTSMSGAIADFSEEIDQVKPGAKPDPETKSQISKKLMQLFTPSEEGQGNDLLPPPLQKFFFEVLLGQMLLPPKVESLFERIFEEDVLGSMISNIIDNVNFTATERRNPHVPEELGDSIKFRLHNFAKGERVPEYTEVPFHYPQNLREEMEKLEVDLSKLIGQMLNLWQPGILKHLQRISILDPSGNIINGKIHEALAKLAVRNVYQTMQNKFRKDKTDDELLVDMDRLQEKLRTVAKKSGPGLDKEVQKILEDYVKLHMQLSTHSQELAALSKSQKIELQHLPDQIVKLSARRLFTKEIRKELSGNPVKIGDVRQIVKERIDPFYLRSVEFYYRGGRGSTRLKRLTPVFEKEETRYLEIDSDLYKTLMEDLKIAILDPRQNEFSAKKMLSFASQKLNEEVLVKQLMIQKTRAALWEIGRNDKKKDKKVPCIPELIDSLFEGDKKMHHLEIMRLLGIAKKNKGPSELAKFLLSPLNEKEGILDFAKDSDQRVINEVYEVLAHRMEENFERLVRDRRWHLDGDRVEFQVGSGEKTWLYYFMTAKDVQMQKKLLYFLLKEATEDSEYLFETSNKEKEVIKDTAVDKVKGMQHEIARSVFYEFRALFFGIDSAIHRLFEKIFYPMIKYLDPQIAKIPKAGRYITFKALASRLADIVSLAVYLVLGSFYLIFKGIGMFFRTFWVLLDEFPKGVELKKKLYNILENKLPERMLDPKEVKHKKLNSLVWDYLGNHFLDLLLNAKKDIGKRRKGNEKINKKMNHFFPMKV